EETRGARAGAAGGYGGLAFSDGRWKLDVLNLRQCGHAGVLAVAKVFAKAAVFVDQPLEVEEQLVAERADGRFGQAAAADVRVLGLVHQGASVRGQDVADARRQPAIGDDADAAAGGFRVAGELLADYVGIAAEIVEARSGGNGDVGQLDVEAVGDGRKDDLRS